MEVKYVYFAGDKTFQIGDVVRVMHKKSYENETKTDIGVILPSVLTSELRLDCSEIYHSRIIEVDLKDIKHIFKLD